MAMASSYSKTSPRHYYHAVEELHEMSRGTRIKSVSSVPQATDRIYADEDFPSFLTFKII